MVQVPTIHSAQSPQSHSLLVTLASLLTAPTCLFLPQGPYTCCALCVGHPATNLFPLMFWVSRHLDNA